MAQWKAEYNVNVPEIDAQHRKWIDMLNAMQEAMVAGRAKDELGNLFEGIIAYTRTHFATEERMMREANYPEYTQHKAMHDDFIKRIETMSAGPTSVALTLQTASTLKDWLVNHILSTDQKYAPYLAPATR